MSQKILNQWKKKLGNYYLKTGKEGRRTGLGFTALADMVAALGMAIDSDDAIMKVEEIMKEKCRAEFDSSIDMSFQEGVLLALMLKLKKHQNLCKC